MNNCNLKYVIVFVWLNYERQGFSSTAIFESVVWYFLYNCCHWSSCLYTIHFACLTCMHCYTCMNECSTQMYTCLCALLHLYEWVFYTDVHMSVCIATRAWMSVLHRCTHVCVHCCPCTNECSTQMYTCLCALLHLHEWVFYTDVHMYALLPLYEWV